MIPLRFLWRYVRRYTTWLAVGFAAMALFGATTALLLSLLRPLFGEVLLAEDEMPEALEATGRREEIFDRIWTSISQLLGIDDENVVVILPLLFAGIFVLRSLAAFSNGYLFQRVGLGATNDLRNDLYRRVLYQSSRFFSEHPTGELISRIGYDISVVQTAISHRVLDLFQQSATLVIFVWYLLALDFWLAVSCLVVAPALFYPIVRFGRGMRLTSRHSQERLAEVANLVSEAARGHRVVKAFGMEEFELGRFRSATRRHLKVSLRAQLLAHGSGPVIESLIALGSAVFLIYAGRTVRSGALEPAEVVAFLAVLVLLYDPIRKLNKVNLILQESVAAIQRVRRVMEVPPDVEERPGAKALAPLRSSVRFVGVSFAYDREAVLHGVDLEIARGEVVALVGPSGAGKSTLVSLLPRFFDPDAGRVEIDGTDIREVSLESLRAQIGLVTQDTILFNDTVRNNVAYGRADLPMERVEEAAQAAFADRFIAQLPEGYGTLIGEGGLKLSGGQRQRLAIARALLKDPPLLILDEATSHLDSESEALVQRALYNLMRGRTALVIAHRLSTVQRADRIVVLDQGRIVEEGVHSDLLSRRGLYRRLYDLQFERAHA